MRILIIAPKSNFPDDTPAWLRIPQLSLSILAALTPKQHETVCIEENADEIPMDEHWDIVGMSAMTATISRAYELAAIFRKKGSVVVIGGIHASILPDEAAQHADVVVVGEAEGIWPAVVGDIERKQHKKIYHNLRPEIVEYPMPIRKKRLSFLGIPPYIMPIMSSRGCPHDCEFCSVHGVYGRKQRFVPVEAIVRDIKESGSKLVMFLDDNLGANRAYAMKLFEAMRPLKVRWLTQTSVRFILDDELFSAALKAGCEGLFIGVESVEAHAMKKIRKSLSDIALYEKAIKKCRDAGVIFHASLIFGLDEQGPEVFDNTLNFLLDNAVPSINPNILTPYPGTVLHEKLKKEDRILHFNWAYYDHTTVSFRPKNMSPQELSERFLNFRDRFYSYSSILRRGIHQLGVHPLMYLGMNLAYRRSTRNEKMHANNYFQWLDQRSLAEE